MGREDEKKVPNIFSDDDFALFEDVVSELEEQDEGVEIPESDNIQVPPVENPDEEEQNDDEEEEVETPEGVVEDEESEDLEEEQEENPSLFSPYIKFLSEEGILSNVDVDNIEGTADGLKKAMSNEINYHIEQYKSQMPAEVKRLLDGYEQGVPFDEMLKVTSDAIRYDNIKEESLSDSTDLQKNLVLDYLNQTTKLSDKMKEKMVSQWEDAMELEDQAKMALGELKSLQDQKEQELISRQQAEMQAYQKQQEEALNNLEKYISSTEEVIPGIKINQVVKDNIKKNLTVPVEYDQFGNPVNKLGKYMRENPIEGEFMLNYIFETTGGFKDWSLFTKIGKSKAISEMERVARMVDDGSNKGTLTRKKRGAANDPLKGIESFLQNM